MKRDPTMRGKMLWAVVSGTVVAFASAAGLASGVFLKPAEALERQEKNQNETATEKKGQLPIAQVVLFSSGVGYFQREGTVEGNTRVDLSFPVQDINDFLKSMVLQDM